MTTVRVQAIGFAWFRSMTTPGAVNPSSMAMGCRALMRTGCSDTIFERMRANGQTVERVMIDPATFHAWCRENGFELTPGPGSSMLRPWSATWRRQGHIDAG